jgi:hypothetical protein
MPKYKILWKYIITSFFRSKKEKKNSEVIVLGKFNSRPEIKTPQEVIELINKKKITNAEKHHDLQVSYDLSCFI